MGVHPMIVLLGHVHALLWPYLSSGLVLGLVFLLAYPSFDCCSLHSGSETRQMSCSKFTAMAMLSKS